MCVYILIFIILYKLRVFDLKPGGGFKCLLKCDVVKELARWKLRVDGSFHCTHAGREGISSAPSGVHRGTSREADRAVGCIEVESGTHILGLFYMPAAAATTTTNIAEAAAQESSIG